MNYSIAFLLPATLLALHANLPIQLKNIPDNIYTYNIKKLTSRIKKDSKIVIITGNTEGYIQECGCTTIQPAGLARKIQFALSLNTFFSFNGFNNCSLIDLGNLSDDPKKSKVVLECLENSGYDSVFVSQKEFSLGDAFLSISKQFSVRLIFPLQETSVSDIKLKNNVHIVNMQCNYSKEKEIHLKNILNKTDSHTIIYGTDDWKNRLSPNFVSKNNFLIVSDINNKLPNNTNIINKIQKDEILIIVFDKNKNNIIERIKIPNFVPEDSKSAKLIGSYFSSEANNIQSQSASISINNDDLGYIPPENCRNCHIQEYKKWSFSSHAVASRTLENKNRLIGECLNCHSELYRRKKIFKTDIKAAWHGITCSTCHGDGIQHNADRKRTSITRSVKEDFCRKCHDSYNDPKFNYLTYLEKIRHW